jgi:hypothetical protein
MMSDGSEYRMVRLYDKAVARTLADRFLLLMLC